MTALRELAERWKRQAQCTHALSVVRNTKEADAAELLSILDAEGDGGAAVAWMAEDDAALSARMSGRMGGMNDGTRFVSFKELKQGDYRHVFTLYAHPQPVRSGMVSDEIAESACSEALRKYRADCPNCEIDGADFDAGFYAALEHFAKSQGESNV